MVVIVLSMSKEPEGQLDPAGREHKSTEFGDGGGARKG
jgi:hypothetical protein